MLLLASLFLDLNFVSLFLSIDSLGLHIWGTCLLVFKTVEFSALSFTCFCILNVSDPSLLFKNVELSYFSMLLALKISSFASFLLKSYILTSEYSLALKPLIEIIEYIGLAFWLKRDDFFYINRDY